MNRAPKRGRRHTLLELATALNLTPQQQEDAHNQLEAAEQDQGADVLIGEALAEEDEMDDTFADGVATPASLQGM